MYVAADNGSELILRRLQLLAVARSSCRAIPLDAEGEEFKREATPITGLPDLLDRIASRLSAATDIPVSLLMGEVAGHAEHSQCLKRLGLDDVDSEVRERALIGVFLAVVSTWRLLTNGAFGDGLTFHVPWVQVVVLVVLTALASLLATIAPAQQASRIRPAVALRLAD